MIYRDFKDKKLSMLGFGTMRLPTLADGSVDKEQVRKMTALAMERGVNYFDTAVPYHNGMSEKVMGEILSAYPRESYFLASKFPGHQVMDSYDCEQMFADQLARCGVDYFDFYLLHNVSEVSIDTYTDLRWSIPEYFIKQRNQGRVRHLGFSSHGSVAFLREFLDKYGEHMEFCLIQLNYLDWTLQEAKEKYDLLTEHGIAVMVMEPLRGGALASLSAENMNKLHSVAPNETAPSAAFRFLQGLDNVKVVLSGMSDYQQMWDNLNTFEQLNPASESEKKVLLEIAEGMKDSVPCTACRYCVDGCPMKLNIPQFLSLYNELRVAKSVNVSMKVEFLADNQKPSACISCGACTHICPQKIDIPSCLADFTEILSTMPSWAQISKEREQALKKIK